MVAVRTCMVVACSSVDWLLQLPGAVLLIGRAPFVYWGVSNYCALTEVFLLPRIQLCSLHRLSWVLLPYDYRHDYFLVSSMLKLSSSKPSKYTRWIFASIGRFVTRSSSWSPFLRNRSRSQKKWLQSPLVVSRDEHGSGLDRTGQDWRQFWPDQDWIGLQLFWKLADWSNLLFWCDYSSRNKNFSCNVILQIS